MLDAKLCCWAQAVVEGLLHNGNCLGCYSQVGSIFKSFWAFFSETSLRSLCDRANEKVRQNACIKFVAQRSNLDRVTSSSSSSWKPAKFNAMALTV